MNPSGGTLEIPACGTYSGQIAYPSFSGNAGTISATLQVSETNDVFGVPAHLTNSGAFLYVGFVLSSSNASDAAITLGSLSAGAPASCGQIDGAFTNGTEYFAEAELEVVGSLERQSFHNTAGPGTWQGAGCTLNGQGLAIGAQNLIILSTSDQFFN